MANPLQRSCAVMWFNNWMSLYKVALATSIGYAYMLTLVRLGGKRLISKKNASDFIITVAVGSAMAALVMSPSVTIAEGLVGLGMLLLLQFIVVTASTRSAHARRIVEGRARLLFWKGHFIREQMRREEVNDSEVMQAIRNEGYSCLDDIYAVVLEIDGSFSVVVHASDRPTALVDIEGMPLEELAAIRQRAGG